MSRVRQGAHRSSLRLKKKSGSSSPALGDPSLPLSEIRLPRSLRDPPTCVDPGPESDDPATWRRFETATVRALLRLRTSKGRPQNDRPSATPASWSVFEGVLESTPAFSGPAPRDRAKMTRLTAFQAIKAFVLDRLRAPDAPDTLVVSVSGGVDSVVLLYCVSRIVAESREDAVSRATVVGVHVDYGNRDDSADEAAFVAGYCAWLDVPLWTRTITEVKRNAFDPGPHKPCRTVEARSPRLSLEISLLSRLSRELVGPHHSSLQEGSSGELSGVYPRVSPRGVSPPLLSGGVTVPLRRSLVRRRRVS